MVIIAVQSVISVAGADGRGNGRAGFRSRPGAPGRHAPAATGPRGSRLESGHQPLATTLFTDGQLGYSTFTYIVYTRIRANFGKLVKFMLKKREIPEKQKFTGLHDTPKVKFPDLSLIPPGVHHQRNIFKQKIRWYEPRMSSLEAPPFERV